MASERLLSSKLVAARPLAATGRLHTGQNGAARWLCGHSPRAFDGQMRANPPQRIAGSFVVTEYFHSP